LKSWFDQGHELAGHGWVHQAAAIRNWRHRWHSRLVSRRAAEHLCLDDTEIADLLQRCFAWFPQHDLPEPSLYVPPAWALGPISRETLRRSPFALIESTGGVTWTSTGKHRWLPLVGFEADTELRRWALRCWNRANQAAAGRVVRAAPDQEPREHSPLRPQPGGRTRPLRIAIHPHDHRLRLRKDLQRLLEQPGRSRCYRDLLTDARQRACDVIAPASRT
jgi:predicted deacetylase